MDEIEAEWIECSINQVKLTLSQLSNSQLIQSNLYNLMDFMSAIEILDDRTDSYSTTTTTTTTTALNPLASISYPILIHLIDFIFTLEQSYWHGIPLISSLWTCHFFRSHPLLSLSSSSSPPHRILLAFLLSTIKITELQYDELCKNNVHENEDLHLATASIIFQTLLRSGFGHPTTVTNEGEERGVVIETDDVLKLVDETILLINEEDAMDNQLKQALIGRLAIRMDLIMIHALLLSPLYTSPQQIFYHLSRVTAFLPTLSLSSFPSFNPMLFPPGSIGPSQLPSPQPIRTIPPISYQASLSRLNTWTKEISHCIQAWELILPNHQVEKGSLYDSLEQNSFAFRLLNALPYPRSVYQSLLTPPFILSPLPSPTSFPLLISLIPISPNFLTTLFFKKSKELTWDAPARSLLGWFEGVETWLLDNFRIRAENLGRERRRRIKYRRVGKNLIGKNEAGREKFERGLKKLELENEWDQDWWNILERVERENFGIEVLLIGFGATLLVGLEEMSQAWWEVGKICDGLFPSSSLEDGKEEGKRELKLKVIRNAAKASWLHSGLFPKKSKSTTTTKKISPFLIQSDEHSRKVMDTLDEARFNLRFSFLNDDANDDEGGSSWESYRKDRDELCSESEEELKAKTAKAYEATLLSIDKWIQAAEHTNETGVWIRAASKVCRRNLDVLNLEEGGLEGDLLWEEGVDWFPVFNSVLK